MYNIGFDLGSASIKGAIVDSNSGKELITLNEPKKEMNIISSQNDWAEQSPNKWRVLLFSIKSSAKLARLGI